MLLKSEYLSNYRNISTILIFSCIDTILRVCHENCRTIFSVNSDYYANIPLIQYHTGSFKKNFPLVKPEVYIIDTSSDDLENILKSLEFHSFFNPAASFLLIVDIADCQVMSIFRKYSIFIVLIIENYTEIVYGCDDNQIDGISDSSEPTEIGQCTKENMTLIQNYMKRKIRDEWNNFTLKVGVGNSPPTVIQQQPGDPYTGMDIDIIEFIAGKMKFHVIYEPSQNFVGTKNDFTYDGALGMLANKTFDMITGGMFATRDSCLDFTVSYPIHRSTYSWFVPGPISIPFWKKILLIYQPPVSIAIFLFYLLMTLIQPIFDHLKPKGRSIFYNEFFKLLSSAASAPIRIPQTELYSKKMFYVSWFFFWLILNASFASKLLGSLIQKKYYFPINSLNDLNKANLEICILNGLEFGLDEYKGRVRMCTECEKCLNRTAFQKDLVTVRNTELVDFYQSKYYLDPNGDPLIHPLKEQYFAIYNVMIFRKNHPLFHRFNEILRRMITFGINAYLRKKYSASLRKSLLVNQWTSLKLNPLKFIFHFWFYGLSASAVIFLTELIIAKCGT